MATTYYQKVYDDGSSQWCYYSGTTIDPTPASVDTTPNWVGPISQHCVLRSVPDVTADASDMPTETVTAGFDDLTSTEGWHFEATGDATIDIGATAAVYDFAASGVLISSSGTGSAELNAWRANTALALDATVPIVLEYRIRPVSSGVYDDTEFTWLIGASDPVDGNGVVLAALWDDPSSTRTYALAVLGVGGAPLVMEPVLLPALGASDDAYRIRLTITPTGATVEAAIDEGAWSELATTSTAPNAATYHPFFKTNADGAAGNRALLVDYVRWSAARDASSPGTTTPNFEDALDPGGVTDHGALTGLADDDHTQYALVTGARAITGLQTFNAGIAVTGNVASTTVTTTGDINATGDAYADSFVAVGNFFAQGGTENVLTNVTGAPIAHVGAGGAEHAEATTSAAGFMSAEDKDRQLTRQTRILLWQDEFVLGLTNRWGLDTTGAGSTVSGASAGGSYPGAKVNINTGTTSTGVAGLRTPINFFYQAGVTEVRMAAIVGITGALPDGTDNYIIRVCGIYLSGSLLAGFSFLYDHTVSANWLLVRYAGGVVAASADTGIAAATGGAPLYGERRFEVVFTPASGGTLTGYIDGTQVAQLTGSLTSISAMYFHIARIEKTLGTNARSIVVDYSYADCVPAATFRK